MATGDALLANTRAIGHVTVESRESYIRRKMAENGWDRQTAIAQATHLYPEEMDDLRAPWANRQLYTGEGGHSPDTAAQALHDEGRLAEPTVDAFWDAVRGDIETIGKAKRRELDAAEAEAAAALAWGKERHDQTLAAIELQDDAVGLGLGEARSSIGGDRLPQKTPLVAMHFLSASHLASALRRGGLPSPSIAVSRDTEGWNLPNPYGDCLLFFKKDAVDPKADPRNLVFPGDAMTPRHPKDSIKKGGLDHALNELRSLGWDALTEQTLRNEALNLVMRTRTEADDEIETPALFALWVNQTTGERLANAEAARAYAERFRNAESGVIEPWLKDRYGMDTNFFRDAGHLVAYSGKAPSSAKAAQEAMDSTTVKPKTSVADTRYATGDLMYAVLFSFDDIEAAREAIKNSEPLETGAFRAARERLADALVKPGVERNTTIRRFVNTLANETSLKDALALFEQENPWFSTTPEARQAFLDLVDTTLREKKGYYEAKPRRIVGLDEIALAVIPSDQFKLKWELEKRGIPYETYPASDTYAIDQNHEVAQRAVAHARFSIGGIFTGARMPYDRADSRFIGSGTGGQNEGFGHYGSGVRGVAQGKYASAYIPKKPKTWAQLPVNGDKRFPTLGKLGRICKTWTRVMPAEEENAWMFFAALANDAVSGKLPKGNVKAALKQAIRDELERERQAAEAYHAWRDATIQALLRGEQAERKTRRQEAAEARAASAYETYIKLGFDKDEVLDERLNELLDVPVNIPAVMEQVWFTNRPEGDLSHLLNWLEPVPEEQKRWIKRAFERRHGVAETRSIVDDALAEEKITGRDLYEALRQFYWGTLRDTGMVTTEDLIQSEVAQFLLSADIDGTRYPVDYRKGVTDGSHGWNYVAFSDEHMRVVRRWVWNEETETFELDRAFTPPQPTMDEARATVGDDQALAEAQASRSSIIGRIGARRLDWAGYRLMEDKHGTRRLVQGQEGRTLLEGLRDAEAEVKALVGTDFTRGERARATRLSRSGPIRRDQVALAERWHRHETSENPETSSEYLADRHWGWTLGKDGQWRLEIPYGILRAGVSDALQTVAAENDAQASEAQSAALGDILEDEPLFAAYPELREAPVIPMPGDRDRWGRAVYGYAGNGTIVLFTDKLRDQAKLIGTLYHEIQHLIQHIEGFEGGEGRKVPTWSFYANAMGEAEARVAGASAMTPYGYEMDAYFRQALELTEGEIRDETGTWRRQTYDDLTFEAQRDKILRGQDDATQGIMNQFANAKTLEALAKLAKKHLDVTEMTWGTKDGGGFEVTVEYDDDTIWWNTYGSEEGALNSMRSILLNRYANRTSEARSSISGPRSVRRPPIEARDDTSRANAFNAVQEGKVDARQRVFVADVPNWANTFGFHGTGITGNGYILDKLYSKHGFTAETFNAVINAIKRPIAVLFERHAKSGKPELVIFTDVVTRARDGRMAPTMIILVQEWDHLEIASAYAPDAILEARKAAKMKSRALLFADKERAKKLPLLAATKLALASFNGALGPSPRTIAKPGAEVNTENTPRTDIGGRETLRLPRETEAEVQDPRSSIGGIERGAQAASLYFGRAPTYRDLNAKSLAEVALFATGKKQTRQKVAEAYASFGVSVTPETAAVIADRINADLEEQRNARRSRLKPGEQPRDRAFGLVDALAKAYDANWAEAQKEAFSKGVAGTFGAAREMAEDIQTLMEARRQEAEAVTGTAPAVLETEMGFDIEATLLAAPEPSPRATGRRRRSPRHFTRTLSSCEMGQTSRTTTRACESCMTRRRLSLAGRVGRGDGMDSEKTSEQRGHRVYSLELLALEEARIITEDTASTALPRARDLTSTIAKPGRGSQSFSQ